MDAPSTGTIDLAEFIRTEGATILKHWESRVRRVSVAHAQSTSSIIDHLPSLLAAIARHADAYQLGMATPPPEGVSGRHATERLAQGYGLAQVVDEYVELRACIFERLEELDLVIEPGQNRQLHRAIDKALRETVHRFTNVHEKMVRAMDKLAVDSARSLDDTLANILRTLKETAGADVDSVAILLLGDDGVLHLKACDGFDELDESFAQPIGVGFAGMVAQTRQPILLRDAATDPMVVSEAIRHRGTRALYGVPMIDGDRVVGVAHIGSKTASEFADEDLLLFRALTERATSVIGRAQAIDLLERTAHFREQFIAVLGHDLRSPLNAILLATQSVLVHEGDRERVRATLRRVERSALRMNRLVADILDFARARLGGGFPLRPALCSLLDLVHEVSDELAPLYGRRHVEIVGDDVRGKWDRDRLAQLLSNVMGNAVQHSMDGAKVQVRVARVDGAAEVEVWNEGPPIPAGISLWEPFERGTVGGGGLGLGLYIARRIAIAHRGDLTVQSDDRGTTFTLRLPLS